MGDLTSHVVHTPGYTKGSFCLYESKLKTLFSRDLFCGGVGKTDLPGGGDKALFESLEKLATLEVEILYSGHEFWVERDESRYRDSLSP